MPDFAVMSDEQLAEHLAGVNNLTAPAESGAIIELQRRSQLRIDAAEARAKATLETTGRLTHYTLLLTLSTAVLALSIWTLGGPHTGLELSPVAQVVFVGGGFLLAGAIGLHAIVSLVQIALGRKRASRPTEPLAAHQGASPARFEDGDI